MLPVLWSFRRCPYAIRARVALDCAGIVVEHREIVLRDKPDAFLTANPEGTVPVLVTDQRILIHSRDIMVWALEQNDPCAWLDMPESALDVIDMIEGPFKGHLDRYKYAARNPGADPEIERDSAAAMLLTLEPQLASTGWIAERETMADYAILPFVRQFAHVDQRWFYDAPWPALIDWLDRFKSSERFARVMQKHPLWQVAA